MHVDQHEVQVDVSQDRNRMISDRSRPFTMVGTAVDVVIPFSGDPGVFQIKPTTYTSMPPRGRVSKDQLSFTFQGTSFDPERLRTAIQHTLRRSSLTFAIYGRAPKL